MSFTTELQSVINRHSKENGSNTPDFILAEYLTAVLASFDEIMRRRDKWYDQENKSNDSFQWTLELQGKYISQLEGQLFRAGLLPKNNRKDFVDAHTPKPQAEKEEPYHEFVGRTKTNLYKEFIQKQPQAENKPEWEIVAWEFADEIFKNKKFVENNFPEARSHSVKRLSDGEVFSVGDYAGKRGYEEGLIKEFKIVGADMYAVINHRLHHTINFLIGEIEKFPPKPQPQKEEQRIEVDGFIEKVYGGYKFHAQYDYSQYEIPEEKFPLIKKAIESVLNNESPAFDWMFRYTQSQVDSMCEDAFNAGRERDFDKALVTTTPSKAIKQMIVYADKYLTFQDYQNSKQKQ